MGSACATLQRFHGASLLWLDAHVDCNTAATSPSGSVHGMPLAALLGLDFYQDAVVAPARVALVGVCELDRGERETLKQYGVNVYTMNEVDRFGMAEVVDRALHKVGPVALVSFDLDVLDPALAPGVGTPVRGGLTYREASLAMEMIAEAGFLRCLDVVEVNPILSPEPRYASRSLHSAPGPACFCCASFTLEATDLLIKRSTALVVRSRRR